MTKSPRKKNRGPAKKISLKKHLSKKNSKKRVGQKTESSNGTANTLQLGADIWPIERDVLFRPGRMKYVRKIIQSDGCVFCSSANAPDSSSDSLRVFKTKLSQVVINKFPYNSGHLLVLPLRHVGDIETLSDEEYLDLSLLVKTSITAMTTVYQPHGFNLGLNHGSSAGAGIPGHLHYHLVPRWNADLNFFPLIAETKLVVEDLQETYNRYLTYFGNL
jgi:ATP adenylyltransferase